MSINLYSLLPDTLDTQHAKELTEMQSEVGGLNIPQQNFTLIIYIHLSLRFVETENSFFYDLQTGLITALSLERKRKIRKKAQMYSDADPHWNNMYMTSGFAGIQDAQD